MRASAIPLVTIAIPTYNRADSFLRYAIDSALKQTYQNVEIIIADNCSTDNTDNLVKKYSDPCLKYFRQQKNIGATNNFKFCLEQAKGDYFLMLHDDDLIDEDFVEACMIKANYSKEFGVIRTGTRVIDETGKVLSESFNNVEGLSIEEFLRGWFSYKTSLYLCSTLFNTNKLRETGGLHSKQELLQDCVAIVKLAYTYGRVDVREIKASFRKHSNEITFAVGAKKWGEDFLDLLQLICSLPLENKNHLCKEGERFFATLTYNRAKAIPSRLKRFNAYLSIFRLFKYRYLPPPLKGLIHRFKKIVQSK